MTDLTAREDYAASAPAHTPTFRLTASVFTSNAGTALAPMTRTPGWKPMWIDVTDPADQERH